MKGDSSIKKKKDFYEEKQSNSNKIYFKTKTITGKMWNLKEGITGEEGEGFSQGTV